jgi:hypothetical protein
VVIRLRLYPEGFFEVFLPVPSLSEQRAIVAHIAKETAKLDELRAATERTTLLLKERRAALIAAAVIGQIDVGRRHRRLGGHVVKKVPPPVPIPQPPAPPPGLAADVVASGLPVHPEDRIRLFSPDQWERFVQEWVDSLRDEYDLVERCGGAGDMGRDVIATVKGGNGAWDNYQCKHYQKALEAERRLDRAGQARVLHAEGRVLVSRELLLRRAAGRGRSSRTS